MPDISWLWLAVGLFLGAFILPVVKARLGAMKGTTPTRKVA